MNTDGASGVILGIFVLVVGSIALSASALLLLREGPAADMSPPTAATATLAPTSEASPAEGDATLAPTPTSSTTQSLANTPTATPSATPSATEPPPEEREYTVVAGDALELIAAELGVSAAAIIERNGLVPPYTLEVGQVLVIPEEGASP